MSVTRIIKLLANAVTTLMVVICFLGVSVTKSQPSLTEALDYDGDGKADKSIFRPSSNTWWISGSSGSAVPLQQFGMADTDTLIPGDFDGDGKGDIAIWRESNQIFWYLRSSDFTTVIVYLGRAGDEPVARDYDGDGKTDCALVRRENSSLLWFVLQSSTNTLVGNQFGIDTDFPAPGDFDGDGRFDIAIHRATNQNLYFWILGSTIGLSVSQYGFENDLFLPGDYDGDGKTDLAVGRDLGGGVDFQWWIQNSSDNSAYYIDLGDSDLGDIPVQADYDGDGKTDPAVWRSPLGQFVIRQSSNAQIVTSTWGTQGDLPVASYDTH